MGRKKKTVFIHRQHDNRKSSWCLQNNLLEFLALQSVKIQDEYTQISSIRNQKFKKSFISFKIASIKIKYLRINMTPKVHIFEKL